YTFDCMCRARHRIVALAGQRAMQLGSARQHASKHRRPAASPFQRCPVRLRVRRRVVLTRAARGTAKPKRQNRELKMTVKAPADFQNFDALDIRAGRITKVEDAQTKKPTYRITVDLGPEIGTKVSCGAYRNYAKDHLLGKTVVCVVNFGVKKMGPEI